LTEWGRDMWDWREWTIVRRKVLLYLSCNPPHFGHSAIVWQPANSKSLNLVASSILWGGDRVPLTHPWVAALRTHSDLQQLLRVESETNSSSRQERDSLVWLFSDPSQWCDCRPEKVNTWYADFKHKKTQDMTWLGDQWVSLWVGPKLAAMATAFHGIERLENM
jgi:hypothetical protein